jgi:farnesyl-diphosphate farnesyltransferase
MSSFEYCRTILPKVSRTFALNISFLSGESYRAVLVGYLICRILDTVEDDPKLAPANKISLLKDFTKLITGKNISELNIKKWVREAKVLSGNSHELSLVAHTREVIEVYFSLSEKMRDVMRQPIETMSAGMAEYVRRAGKSSKLIMLRDEADLERYCYYVAGTVGELLTGIFTQQMRDTRSRSVLEREKINFGLALQLTNILKDFRTDAKRKWSYIPVSILKENKLSADDFISNRYPMKSALILRRLLSRTSNYLDHSLTYTLALPRLMFRERIFCALPLFIAAHNLLLIARQADKTQIRHKVSRSLVKFLLLFIPLASFSNTLLSLYYNFIRRSIAYELKRS